MLEVAETVGDSRCKVTKNWNDIITLSVCRCSSVGRGQSWQPEGSEGGVATLLCSVHAPGISQFADRRRTIPENGVRALIGKGDVVSGMRFDETPRI
jgi:hypothetical protein